MAKSSSNEFVLAAFDERGNLMLAAQGNEVLAKNLKRLANFSGGIFKLEWEGTEERPVFAFKVVKASGAP